jgi:hypothetical protein
MVSVTTWAWGTALLALACFAILTLQRVYNAVNSPLRDVPGPFLAKLSRFWLLKTIAGRKFHEVNVYLHKKYGTPPPSLFGNKETLR